MQLYLSFLVIHQHMLICLFSLCAAYGYDSYGRQVDYYQNERERYYRYYQEKEARIARAYYEEYYGAKYVLEYDSLLWSVFCLLLFVNPFMWLSCNLATLKRLLAFSNFLIIHFNFC